MHQTGGGGETHRHPALAGGQAQPQGHVSLAGAAVADGDDVLPALDVFTPGQFHHQRLVYRGDGREVEGVQTLHRGESGGADPPLHHALVAVNEFPLGEAQQVLRVVHILGGALGCHLTVLPEKAGAASALSGGVSNSSVDRSFMPPALRGESYNLVQTWCSPGPGAGRDTAPGPARAAVPPAVTAPGASLRQSSATPGGWHLSLLRALPVERRSPAA